jgi:Rrf2 family nitric oxide-sensitive transcriptional repressor
MNKMNRKLEYSLMALKHMSLKMPGELTSAKEVSESYSAPFDATARVLQMMAQKGILRSEQGAQGGYQITRDLAKVTLHDLIETIEGPTQIAKCISNDEPCGMQSNCNIISPVTTLNQKLNEFYQNLSLKELLFTSEGKERKDV